MASFENDWTTHTITLREHDLGPEDVTQVHEVPLRA